MSTLTLAARDSSTMVRRQLKRMIRYPSMTVMLVAMPVVFLLLFVYVFGGTLGAGIGGGPYVNYVTPGILLMAVLSAATGTAVSVAMDMTEGIVARFRTMRIARGSILAGHVVGSVIQQFLCMGVVLAVALAIGFRPNATPVEWVAVAGLMGVFSLAMTWLSVALGVKAPNVESASNAPMPLILLPFLGSGFVPTDSMPTVLRWFAEYQPFTPIMETLRGLLMGQPIGNSAIIAVAWCAGIGVLSYIWAKRLFNRS
ncbi:ABC transporter permease [Herbidospora mongoliensis]|uniref:ABC transporter permease n=1 Tax=Herbidospora mongoliensis TaxID=688067 RepID=UPI000831C825|nr:ABC transporter permease [Herbidospora mongoliensis]